MFTSSQTLQGAAKNFWTKLWHHFNKKYVKAIGEGYGTPKLNKDCENFEGYEIWIGWWISTRKFSADKTWGFWQSTSRKQPFTVTVKLCSTARFNSAEIINNRRHAFKELSKFLQLGCKYVVPRTALLLRTEMTILRADKMRPLFQKVILALPVVQFQKNRC